MTVRLEHPIFSLLRFMTAYSVKAREPFYTAGRSKATHCATA